MMCFLLFGLDLRMLEHTIYLYKKRNPVWLMLMLAFRKEQISMMNSW